MKVPAVVLQDKNTLLAVAGATTAAVGAAYLLRRSLREPKPLDGPFKPDTLPKGAYDVIIVGAGARIRDLAS